jgi:LacI family repressor for deo operon, udp, cdd, tsx, nupC, and nupG
LKKLAECGGHKGIGVYMATIQDVAKEAGVSVATISRVLNNSTAVLPETRELVMEAIKKLNYKPNLLARNLRRTEAKIILVLLPNISNTFYARVVKGIEDVANKNGLNVMLCNTDSDVNRERVYLDLLKNKLADGVIFMAPELSVNELTEIGSMYPVVQCSEYLIGSKVSFINIDNTAAAKKAVNHILSLGHKRIGFLTAKRKFISTIHREQGYRQALEEAGIEFDERLVIEGDYGFKSGIRAGNSFISMPYRPTAVFAVSDMMGLGVIKASIQSGLLVPKDIAVVGFDNIGIAGMYSPGLTTISQPKYDMGCFAMELLLKQLKEKKRDVSEITLEYELIIRESTVG